jgi:ABC-2 type transport system ATP-binding protein
MLINIFSFSNFSNLLYFYYPSVENFCPFGQVTRKNLGVSVPYAYVSGMDYIIEVKDLKKDYGKVQAVKGISFGIPAGVCFGLLGPNGAGKTTTIEMMEGILPPSSGQILFQGAPITDTFREKVGIQFQSTSLPEFITVRETLELFSAFYPQTRPMEEVVEICSLEDILDRDNRKLSGGQKQRMLLGLAILPKPEIVFLDEPTTGLDPQARRNFWKLIQGIKKENTTILLTTHYMEEAEILCDQIAIVDQGEILELDSPAKLLHKHFDGKLLRIPQGEHPAESLQNLGAVLVGGNWEISTTELDKTMQGLFSAKVNLDGLSIHKPNLEDLFLKLTGSSLRA